ncbi:restriction endonuclease subunit S [Pseudomonas aeruginosa]|uniref:restriction endonuclease subunit S n=1 Tax=Pseudomonas aeruginosa TaxID=287 RepID=UPI000F87AD9C|nr:restriction endonuclease subunit S [Pseudomonas aeruginosa]MBM0724222.1 restriction endonuclease subunit S [Pseudomonas aeruginosa]MBM2567728.1 restriction endonuclease subunit S [Pseudomonas aeruginosa]MBY9932127.1 restriction endonuclease subunit S [Pseudomonas aeruginosa]MBY9939071.1 restriction endonuclease subunit S [Pseudomonas aeruginosa]MBY9945106.1 restriction endonuclease subunit S [Pseudomonas aeruginosa]
MAKLSDVAAINPTRKVKKGEFVPFIEMAALPLSGRDISASDVAIRIAKAAGAHFQNGDTLLARITPCLENGKTAQVNVLADGAVGEGSTEFIVLCGHDSADNDFVYYLCREPEFRKFAISRMEGTSGRQRVSWQSIAGYPIELPSPDIRRDAAGFLATLDDRIANLRQINTTLEAIAAALFKSLFVYFDGVPPEDMQESELGLIPQGWRIGILGDLCELNAAKWTDKKHPPTVRYIDLSSVSANRIEAVNEFAFDAAPSRARMQLREGDTIVGTVRPGNRAFAYIHAPTPNLTGSTGFAVLSPKQPHYASFIYLAATRDEAIQRLANLADGAAYPAVRSNVVAETPCAIAPDEVIAEFSVVTKPMLERIEQNNQQATTLANLRDALLPRLLSGQLRVKQ